MATNTHLPVIHSLGTGTTDGKTPDSETSKKTSKTTTFLSRLKLGSLQQVPLPGDVYYPSHVHSKQPRPLGLIPNRNDRLAALKKLNQLFSPLSARHLPHNDALFSDRGSTLTRSQADSEQPLGAISATVKAPSLAESSLPSVDHKKPSINVARTSELDPTLPHKSWPVPDAGGDPDYMPIGEKASEYYAFVGPPPAALEGIKQPLTLMSKEPLSNHEPLSNQESLSNQEHEKKKARLRRHTHAGSDLHYFNFTGQAQLFQRSLTDDRRDALGYEQCERCRLRGGRCARCKVLRTGGGYIILDAGKEEEWMLRKKREGYDFWSGAPRASVVEGRGKQGVHRKDAGDIATDGDGGRMEDGGEGFESGGGSRSGRRWEGRERGRDGLGWGGGDREDGGDSGTKIGTQAQRHGNQAEQRGRDDGSAEGRRVSTSSRGEGRHSSEGGESVDGPGGSVGGGRPTSGYKKEWGEDLQSHASRSGSGLGRSRPGSTHGARPGSSLRRSGRGGLERGKRSRTGTDDTEIGGPSKLRQSRESSGQDFGGGGRRNSRARSRPPSAAQDDGKNSKYEGSEFKFNQDHEGLSEADKDSFHGNLTKFKRKKDDVKAIHATLKELQGIDPLDYLARYCIIDQSKVPHYQHTFNNVDRDEDDEIDIGELDFALKAVNYDLISDAEMEYVHSVLELAGRYKLNFRLFSVIAALSERVVALEDMVKQLINKMDFDALEVKMKKCKELFYLLADSDVALEHEGGVVTTSSLAVELQAGGLTQEHVEFVVDRLNHEDKGLVEFLDYLTYVPLFVEIHDNIYVNPLDFTRTK